MENVFTQYRDEVKDQVYPGPEHTVFMNDDEAIKFAKKDEMGLETRAAGRQSKSGGSAENGQKDIFASKKESGKKESC